MNEEINEQMSE